MRKQDQALAKSLQALIPLIAVFFFAFFFTPSVHAEAVEDQAQLFNQNQVQLLNEQAATINPRFKGELFIVTTTSNTEEPRTFADNYLREKVGNNNNGAVLLMDMGQRQIYISTSGNMIYYLTDRRRDELLDAITPNMSDEQYFQAAQGFLTHMSDYVEAGIPDGYSIDEETGRVTRFRQITTVEMVIALVLAAGLSAVFFFFILSRYQLKNSVYKYPYREKGTVALSEKEDRLVNSFVTTRRIPRTPPPGSGGGGSTTHSSGGGTFGGGGRGF